MVYCYSIVIVLNTNDDLSFLCRIDKTKFYIVGATIFTRLTVGLYTISIVSCWVVAVAFVVG